MGKVIAVCTSARKGVQKENIRSARFEADWGLENDAHAGHWHRQVSLLSADKAEAFRQEGADVLPGAFGENLLVEGIDFRALPVGTRLRCGQVLLEITQIGKECHTHCAIYHKMGKCIMPTEGVFAVVLESGEIAVGDDMAVVARPAPLPPQAAVITLSDRCAAGLAKDKSGPAVAERLTAEGYCVIEQLLLPDDPEKLKKALIRLCDQRQPDLILTTGGTGFSPRDCTPEATLAVAHRNAPGIAEAIRSASLAITPRAMLGRGTSVIRGRTLIVNLPGSVKACRESMDVFLSQMPHAISLLRGEQNDCGRPLMGSLRASSQTGVAIPRMEDARKESSEASP